MRIPTAPSKNTSSPNSQRSRFGIKSVLHLMPCLPTLWHPTQLLRVLPTVFYTQLISHMLHELAGDFFWDGKYFLYQLKLFRQQYRWTSWRNVLTVNCFTGPESKQKHCHRPAVCQPGSSEQWWLIHRHRAFHLAPPHPPTLPRIQSVAGVSASCPMQWVTRHQILKRLSCVCPPISFSFISAQTVARRGQSGKRCSKVCAKNILTPPSFGVNCALDGILSACAESWIETLAQGWFTFFEQRAVLTLLV